jgi:hypothetical protein
MEITTVFIIASLIGAIGRTLVPYALILKENPGTKFDRQFFLPIVGSVLATLVFFPLALPGVAVALQGYTIVNGFTLAGAFGLGWGLFDMIREGQKIFETFRQPPGVITKGAG